jgi:outer membrane protein OmpA-like peptidoglycan-associated protein
MGATAKIIFGSFIGISIALMFMIFEMQESAQLTLDIQEVQGTVQKKEQQIAAIQQNLAETKAAVENANAKSAVIPELKNSIAAAEKEKIAYLQQLDELQGQLKEADAHLAEYSRLQEEFKKQQLLLADTEKAKISADMQTAQSIEDLNALQDELNQRDEQINQFIADLEQKDRVILVYKEKLNEAVDEIALLKENDSIDRLNLNIILDDLAVKTDVVKELTRRIIKLEGSTDISTTSADSEQSEEAVSKTDDQALLEHLTLENNTLNIRVKDQDILIEDLNNEFQEQTDLLAVGNAEIEQMQTTAQSMTEELNAFHLSDQHNQQELSQLKTSLTNKENEFIAIQEHALELAAPLRERIISLEQQLAEATGTSTNSLAEVQRAITNIADLQKENNQLAATLDSTQSSLEEAQKQKTQLESEFQSVQAALEQEQSASQSLSAEIEPFKLALTESEERFEAANSQYQNLENELANVIEENQSLHNQLSQQTDLATELTAVQTSLTEAQEHNVQSNTTSDDLRKERDSLQLAVAKQETAIHNLTTQLTENKAQLSELQAKVQQGNEQQLTSDELAEQEQRVARLIEEIAVAKALTETQTATLQATEEELASLKEKGAGSATLEEENKKLEAALNENQTKLDSDQEKIIALESALSSLKDEREQLLLYTVDSDNDGISDGADKCADTVTGVQVDQQGCEKDDDQDGLVNRLDLCPDTVSGSAPDTAGCSAEQSTVILEGVTFQLGTSELTENAQSSLKHAANILQINPDISMEIAGHTDSIGDPDANLSLSTTRAQAVLNYLVSQGVAENRLQAKGYGSNEPIAENTNDAGRAMNRRVELRKIEAEANQESAQE